MLGHTLEDISDFSVVMGGSAKVKNYLKAHECLHLHKTRTVHTVTPVLPQSHCREMLPTVSLLYLGQVDKAIGPVPVALLMGCSLGVCSLSYLMHRNLFWSKTIIFSDSGPGCSY